MNGAEKTRWIVEQARALGFDLCGVAPAENFTELALLPEWLERGYAGEMEYLCDPRRGSPARLLEGVRSVIVCALNYNTPLPESTEAASTLAAATGDPGGWISRYAWGDDYHKVLHARLDALLAALRARFPEPFAARAYVDTGPVVERVAAKYAGLGWLAKNTCLINERLGSWFFLGVILTTLELEPTLRLDEPPPADLCGQCRLCLDACPTGALVEPYLLDARRCISYLTIELRGSIPEEFRSAMGRNVFGCDICQDVCPWNRKAPATKLAAFLPRQVVQENEKRNSQCEARTSTASPGTQLALPGRHSEGPPDAVGTSLFAPSLEWLASLSETEFGRVFCNSAVKRAKWRGLVRNACIALGNAAGSLELSVAARVRLLLERLAASPDALIAEHARWALARLLAAGHEHALGESAMP